MVGVAPLEAPTAARAGQSERAAMLLRAAVVAVPLIILVIAAWQYRWMSDDGFINLRVVSEIRAGHGPVFNAGERVEAFTSPLWLFLLLVGDVVAPIRFEYVAVVLGIVLTVAGVGLAILGACRLYGRLEPRLWIPVGALVLAVFTPMWKMASSGLESGLTFAWLGGCLLVLATWSSRARRLTAWGAVVVGLGPLIRPEFTLLSLGFVGVVLAGQRGEEGWRARLGTVGAAFAIPVAYEIFRMGYYASLVPNSALAKEGFGAYWSAGWAYFRATFLDTYALWVPLLVLGAAAYVPLVRKARREHRARVLLVLGVFIVGGVVDALYIVRVGGDFIQSRLLLPAVFLLLAPVAAVPATRRFLGALLVVPWCVVALVSLRSVYDQPTVLLPSSRNAVTTNDFGYAPGSPKRAWFTGHGVYYLPSRLPGQASGPSPAVATYGIGITGYAFGPDTYILDLFGLGDPFTSHLRLAHRGTVAHEKPLPAPWIAARLLRPGAPVTERDFPSALYSPPLDDPRGEPFASRVRDARRALRCPRLTGFFATYEASLGIGRFFDNLGQSFSNLTFRIPPEPRNAVAAFCRR